MELVSLHYGFHGVARAVASAGTGAVAESLCCVQNFPYLRANLYDCLELLCSLQQLRSFSTDYYFGSS